MRRTMVMATLALGGVLALGGATPASAGTGEAKKCGPAAAAKMVTVNRYTTSCAFGRAVAWRISSGPIKRWLSFETGAVTVRGVRLYVNRPSGRSYYLWNGHGKELSLQMWGVGG